MLATEFRRDKYLEYLNSLINNDEPRPITAEAPRVHARTAGTPIIVGLFSLYNRSLLTLVRKAATGGGKSVSMAQGVGGEGGKGAATGLSLQVCLCVFVSMCGRFYDRREGGGGDRERKREEKESRGGGGGREKREY